MPVAQPPMEPGSLPSGFVLLPDFISQEEEEILASAIDSLDWCGNGIPPNPELKRRTQQYEYLFLYKTRSILEKRPPIPSFCLFLLERMRAQVGIFGTNDPIHLLINEYLSGQGIMPHTDSPALFGPVIVSLSLLSDCLMTFTKEDGTHSFSVQLPRRSLLVMSDEIRYHWKHGISKDLIERIPSFASDGVCNPNKEYVEGDPEWIVRDRRVSLTFRTLLSQGVAHLH